jgi:nitrite reductase/ring-hydroxylating ferredoxin subunit
VQTMKKPGEWVDSADGLADIDFSKYRMNIPTDRYTSPEVAEREHERIWTRVWRVVGRENQLPDPGDWKEYRVRDQSYVIVRGKDGVIRGFVNACRHRGNKLCTGGSGNMRRFLCQYHLWSYDLDGKLKGVLREQENSGPVAMDKDSLSLLPVSVECFGGFIFLNPDPDAAPLADFLGPEVIEILEPYRLEEMVTVMDVREALNCNWKVVMDAFEEGYHISGIHPQLERVILIDPKNSRYKLLDQHSVSMAPFEVANAARYGDEEQVEGILELPETFPSVQMSLPRFKELVEEYRNGDEPLTFPDGITARTLLQRATRETLTGMGLDVSELTDAQMSDNHGWVLFPNFFMTIRAGEATIIMAEPHEDGDPNTCYWHIMSFMWLPEEHRTAFTADPVVVEEPGSYKYEQMPRQQLGLRSDRLEFMSLMKEEVVIAHYHSVVDRYLAGAS